MIDQTFYYLFSFNRRLLFVHWRTDMRVYALCTRKYMCIVISTKRYGGQGKIQYSVRFQNDYFSQNEYNYHFFAGFLLKHFFKEMVVKSLVVTFLAEIKVIFSQL